MLLMDLVQKAQAGDKAALGEICGLFEGLVKKHAFQVHLRVLWEDAVAEGWLAVVQAVKDYDPAVGAPFPGFVESRVKYGLWNLFKRERRRWQRESALEYEGEEEGGTLLDTLADATDLENEVANRLALGGIRQAMQALPEKQRQALELTVIGERSLKSVAGEMGVTIQAVYNLRQRSVRGLKRLCPGMYGSERG